MKKRMLICYAHPDDESFGIGAYIAKIAAEGTEVTLICATNGDVGTVPPEKLQGYNSIGELRLAELQCAAQVLGLHEVITFGYRDSGMMNSSDNCDSRCLWQAPLGQVTDRVAEVMRRIRPHVVITFDPFGGYGHPDHIKMHRATVLAFHRVRRTDPQYPQKLYYAAFPRLFVRIGVLMARMQGQDPRKMGVNGDLDFQAVLDATKPTHARINVADYYEVGMRAADCHASQVNPRRMFPAGQWLMKQIASTTGFTRAYPPPIPGEPIETNLFAGVRL
jgi:LmbE family N-acetylglucosaminyl deacetylase